MLCGPLPTEDHAASSAISWLTDQMNHFNLNTLFTIIKKNDFDMNLIVEKKKYFESPAILRNDLAKVSPIHPILHTIQSLSISSLSFSRVIMTSQAFRTPHRQLKLLLYHQLPHLST